MYNPAHFAETRTEVLHAAMRRHALATLITASEPHGIEASHVPVILHPEIGERGVLRCHLARGNSHWKLMENAPLLAIFQGVEHYVSPGWYPTKNESGKVVPTWNYVVVHVRGKATLFEDHTRLLAHLQTLTAQHEEPFAERWQVSDAPADYIAGLTKAIVGIEIAIEKIEGKWKVSQNRADADRAGVVSGLTEISSDESLEMAALVDLARVREGKS